MARIPASLENRASPSSRLLSAPRTPAAPRAARILTAALAAVRATRAIVGSRAPAIALLAAFAALGGALIAVSDCRADERDEAALRAKRLAAVRRFGYQLQQINVSEAAQSPADLLVVEPQGEERRWTAAEVARLRKKPDGRPRIVLAYLSIGEAEDYRPYWKKEWKREPPAWLGPENPDWKGNFEVRYWDPAWQSIMLGRPDAPLDRIVADGYDGVYLDIVDGFEFWEERGVKDARAQMVAWVEKIARHARASRPEFLVVPQNGEALAEESGYLKLIDALGREDLYFNGDKRQKARDTKFVENYIAQFQKAGKPVLLIEYPRKPENRDEVYTRAREAGYVALVTVRPLNKLLVTPEPAPAPR